MDEASGIARIPAGLVADALAAAPREVVLGARNPAHDLALPSPVTRWCIDGTASFVTDFETGERRYGTTADIVDALRVFQAVDLGAMAWAPTCASDRPSASRAVHEFLTMALASSRHGEHEIHTAAQVPYLEAGLVAIAGSERASASATPTRSSTARWRRSPTTGRCSTATSPSGGSTCP